MADKFLEVPALAEAEAATGYVPKRLKDMGDGTFAEVVEAGLTVETIDIGKVDQGNAGTAAWLVSPKASTWPNDPANVAASTTAVQLAASNTSRTGLIVSNDSTAKLYVLVDPSGSGVVASSLFTYVVQPGTTLELPIGGGTVPTARVMGVWSLATGSAGVTDIS